MKFSTEAEALLTAWREAVKPAAASAIEDLLRHDTDRALCRVNALAFAAERGLDPEEVIAGFLHAARLGIVELSWNVLCPGCGGVLGANATLKTINREKY